jgi:hypothetical protein
MRMRTSENASKGNFRYRASSRSRRSSFAEKVWLPAAFGASPLGNRLPFLVSLLLEPAVNEGAHQGARRDATPEAVAAQAQVGLLFEAHGHRLVAQGSHRCPPAYTSPPLLAPPSSRRASAGPRGRVCSPTSGRAAPPLPRALRDHPFHALGCIRAKRAGAPITRPRPITSYPTLGTGPEAITLHEAAEELTRATGRRVTYPHREVPSPQAKTRKARMENE